MHIKLNKCHIPQELSQIPAIRIKKIWQVDEDRSYSNSKSWASQAGLIMVRTHTGGGIFVLSNGKSISIPTWSFVIFQANQIAKYYTAQNTWKFWWFEVEIAGQFNIPLNRVFEIGKTTDEIKRLDEICNLLATARQMKLSAAAAILLTLICKWCEEWDSEKVSDDECFIRKTIEIFRSNLSKSLNIESVADNFSMSSRWFRKKFAAVTGMTPKRYYDKMRLEIAMEMLRMNLGSINDLSKSLGYSSLYHFSREFKKHFGKSPSKFYENKHSDTM